MRELYNSGKEVCSIPNKDKNVKQILHSHKKTGHKYAVHATNCCSWRFACYWVYQVQVFGYFWGHLFWRTSLYGVVMVWLIRQSNRLQPEYILHWLILPPQKCCIWILMQSIKLTERSWSCSGQNVLADKAVPVWTPDQIRIFKINWHYKHKWPQCSNLVWICIFDHAGGKDTSNVSTTWKLIKLYYNSSHVEMYYSKKAALCWKRFYFVRSITKFAIALFLKGNVYVNSTKRI